jgi:hypothetical protein
MERFLTKVGRGARIVLAATAMLSAVGLSACSGSQPRTSMAERSISLGDALHAQLVASGAGLTDPIIVATFADAGDLRRANGAGEMASEMVAGRLAALGHGVKDVRMARGFVTTSRGEFILSREAKDIAKSVDARSALVGTYVVGDGVAYVSARIVRLSDDRVLAAESIEVPVDSANRPLFSSPGSRPQSPQFQSQLSRP